MKKAINTNAIVFVQADDNNKAVVATRDGKAMYLAWVLKNANEPIYEVLGGKRREGVKFFCVDFPTVKNAKAFIEQAITVVDEKAYEKARKGEPKGDIKLPGVCVGEKPASAKGKKAEKKSNPAKAKGNKPTVAPNANKAEVKVEKATPRKAKGNADLTDAQKKALEVARNSVLNRAAAAYSVANGGNAQVTFKTLGKSEKELAQYIPNAKVGMMKSKKWAYATDKGITEDMLGF